jgi:hypothetical protein
VWVVQQVRTCEQVSVPRVWPTGRSRGRCQEQRQIRAVCFHRGARAPTRSHNVSALLDLVIACGNDGGRGSTPVLFLCFLSPAYIAPPPPHTHTHTHRTHTHTHTHTHRLLSFPPAPLTFHPLLSCPTRAQRYVSELKKKAKETVPKAVVCQFCKEKPKGTDTWASSRLGPAFTVCKTCILSRQKFDMQV